MRLPGPKVTFYIIQNNGSVSDGMGGTVHKWEILITVTNGVYATEKLGNFEERRSGKVDTFSDHKFYMYYDSRVTPAHRVRFGGKDYSIIKVENPAGKNNHLQLKCKLVEGV